MRDIVEAAETGQTRTSAAIAGEAARLAGSAVVTGGVATILVLVAIPVSIGLGVMLGVRSLNKRLRDTGE